MVDINTVMYMCVYQEPKKGWGALSLHWTSFIVDHRFVCKILVVKYYFYSLESNLKMKYFLSYNLELYKFLHFVTNLLLVPALRSQYIKLLLPCPHQYRPSQARVNTNTTVY